MWCSRLTTQEELQASLLGAMRLPVTADSKVGGRLPMCLLLLVVVMAAGGNGGAAAALLLQAAVECRGCSDSSLSELMSTRQPSLPPAAMPRSTSRC